MRKMVSSVSIVIPQLGGDDDREGAKR
jgi:hypothetical protein